MRQAAQAIEDLDGDLSLFPTRKLCAHVHGAFPWTEMQPLTVKRTLDPGCRFQPPSADSRLAPGRGRLDGTGIAWFCHVDITSSERSSITPECLLEVRRASQMLSPSVRHASKTNSNFGGPTYATLELLIEAALGLNASHVLPFHQYTGSAAEYVGHQLRWHNDWLFSISPLLVVERAFYVGLVVFRDLDCFIMPRRSEKHKGTNRQGLASNQVRNSLSLCGLNNWQMTPMIPSVLPVLSLLVNIADANSCHFISSCFNNMELYWSIYLEEVHRMRTSSALHLLHFNEISKTLPPAIAYISPIATIMAGQRPPQSGKQPLSFKTVPGRNKTQKWQQAKTYNYDGDDWGGYDPYDEYGHEAASRMPPQPPYPPQSRPQRAPSFDNEDERRAFSGPSTYGDDPRSHPAMNSLGNEARVGSSDQSSSLRTRPRDFTNPEQVPHPLSTRPSPAPGAQFPPRKSSISSSTSSPAVDAPLPPSGTTTKSEKPLPFIRPADIYKRMAEERERERQSMESSRPSMDSVQRGHSSPHAGATLASKGSTDSLPSGRRPSLDPVVEGGEPRQQPPAASSLAPVHERPGNKAPEFESTLSSRTTSRTDMPPSIAKESSPVLPPVERMSGFGGDFIGGFLPTATDSGHGQQPLGGFQATMDRVFNSPVVATSRTDSLGMEQARSAAGSTPVSYGPGGNNGAVPVDLGQESINTGLQHQPSAGYRSAVNKAFDRADDSSVPPTPISRDNSQSQRSTSDISPIMSHVTSSVAGGQRHSDHDSRVSTITEEPSRVDEQENAAKTASIHRKPSPSHSRNVSSGSGLADVPAGYRRSLDPPSNDNSPARTPAIQDSSDRRLSAPMTAETMIHTEAPDVQDQAAEIPVASLHFTGSQSPEPSHSPDRAIEEYSKALPVASRGRSGTNYGLREADLANAVNSSAEDGSGFSPIAAEARKESEQQFLRDHAASPRGVISPAASTASGPGITQSVSPPHLSSGRNSPTKGRVREIADRYHELEASRRYSQGSLMSNKSSWSNFRGSEENLTLKRKGTDGSQLADDEKNKESKFSANSGADQELDIPSNERPGLQTKQSFVPRLPGGWISAAPTPAGEAPPTINNESTVASLNQRDQSHIADDDEEVDLTPTTKKSSLQAVSPTGDSSSPSNALQQVKDIGAALGASLMSSAGLTSQSRDFASQEPAPPVQQPEMRTKTATGEVFSNSHPPLNRYDSDAASSVANSVPPTPQAKGSENEGNPHSIMDYFKGSVPSSNQPQSKSDPSPPVLTKQPTEVSTLSKDTGSDDYESDRLRQEIIQSLDRTGEEGTASGNIVESTGHGQGAWAATDDVHRANQPLPPVAQDDSHQPALLNQRFSWEQGLPNNQNSHATSGTTQSSNIVPALQAKPEKSDHVPDVLPEMPYERPKSRNLHIMNPNSSDDDLGQPQSDTTIPGGQTRDTKDSAMPAIVAPMSPVSPLRPEEKNLTLPQLGLHGAAGHPETTQQLDVLTHSERPESAVSSMRLPSYYISGPTAEMAGLAAVTTPGLSGVEIESHSTDEATTRPSVGQRIPPFREILAIKSSEQRIEAYQDTRETFAQLDTGLSNWLSTMLAQNPQYASLSTAPQGGYPAPALQGLTPTRHKASPSILKFTKHLGEGGDRKTTSDNAADMSTGSASNQSGDNSLSVDMEKMQQRGKDLMKSAGVFGGKAQAGAKGLFAKGKSRFGTLKRDGGDGAGGKR
nr:hypothetical protein CFP56_69885 [Quercus suber]